MMRRGVWLVVALVLAFARGLQAQQAQPEPSVGSKPDSAMLTPAMINQGRAIFHGRGSCFACHGNKLQGGPIAPSLHGPTWRHIDGTFEAIVHRIDEGYPGSAMVAHPGGITESQVLMVAVYIYAVSHGLAQP
jgi:mono/diheme cytochrome c family protein